MRMEKQIRVLLFERRTVPLANCCSAANTFPPHLGHPSPAAALIDVVSGL